VLGLVAVLSLAAPAAWGQAQSVEDRLREALRRSTVDLRAAQDSQAALQAALDSATHQRDQLQQQLAAAQAQLAQQVAAPAPQAAPAAQAGPTPEEEQQQRAALDDARRQATGLQQELAHWQQAYQQAAVLARTKDQEGRTAATALAAARQSLAACEGKNTKLIGVAQDILHLYQTPQFRSLILQSWEPLLGLKRVELENAMQDQEDRVRAQVYYPGEATKAALPGEAARH
jgi:hypothetical protein